MTDRCYIQKKKLWLGLGESGVKPTARVFATTAKTV